MEGPRPAAAPAQRRDTPVLDALRRGDVAAAKAALAAAPLDSVRADARGATPLMRACQLPQAAEAEEMVDLLLRSGAAPTVAMRSNRRHTAADYASMQGHAGLAARLAALADTPGGGGAAGGADAPDGARKRARCHICGDAVKTKPAAAWLAERVAEGAETNCLVTAFYQSPAAAELLRPEYHRLNDSKGFRKEVSEAWAVVEAIRPVLQRLRAEHGGVHAVDLCCGKSLLTAALHVAEPELALTAVDRISSRLLPHYGLSGSGAGEAAGSAPGVHYLRLDLLAPGALERVAERVAAVGWPCVVLGMHLCGELSCAAVELFARTPLAAHVVLSPCCLPRKGPRWPAELYASPGAAEQYTAWMAHLEGSLRSGPAAAVTSRLNENILSPRRGLLQASKPPAAPAGAAAAAAQPSAGPAAEQPAAGAAAEQYGHSPLRPELAAASGWVVRDVAASAGPGLPRGAAAEVRCTLHNTGAAAGGRSVSAHVARVGADAAPLPPWVLVGFAKERGVPPGGSRDLCFRVSEKQLRRCAPAPASADGHGSPPGGGGGPQHPEGRYTLRISDSVGSVVVEVGAPHGGAASAPAAG